MSRTLPPISDEQGRIIKSVTVDGNHVKVNAVAGSGKTTTIMHIAQALALGESLLVLTYNAKLKSETRERCADMGIKNMAVHTYHSAALWIYDAPECCRDEGLSLLVQDWIRPPLPWYQTKFDVIIVDEAQDMTTLYFSIVCRLLRDVCCKGVRIVVLGDARQSIYGFKGADTRFLTIADRLPLFESPNRSWVQHTLSTTYRLAPPLSKFINSQLLGNTHVLQSGKNGAGTVRYIRCNTFGDLPFQEVMCWLSQGLEGSDIFVLAPSIKSSTKRSPLRKLENRLVRRGIPCYAASSDDERLDEDVTRGKIVFATFHQVKGLERKAVLVFNFDASYHKYFDKEEGHGCSNTIYVAATRAMSHLTLLHDCKQPPIRTLNQDRLASDCIVVTDNTPYKGGTTQDAISIVKERDMSVTELLRHQKQDVLLQALACLDVQTLNQSSDDVSTLLLGKVQTSENSWENVSAITGTAIPCIFEHNTCGKCTLLDRAVKASANLPLSDKARICDLHKISSNHLVQNSLSTADFLFIANVHLALTSGYTHKLRQITQYDWIRDTDVKRMLAIMSEHVVGSSLEVDYEVPASMQFGVHGVEQKVKLACALDCVDSSCNKAFELKCVSHLSTEHVLQTAINAMLFENTYCGTIPHNFRHILLNLCTGEAIEIRLEPDARGVKEATQILLNSKYENDVVVHDGKFLEILEYVRCISHSKDVIGAYAFVHDPDESLTHSEDMIGAYAFLHDPDE